MPATAAGHGGVMSWSGRDAGGGIPDIAARSHQSADWCWETTTAVIDIFLVTRDSRNGPRSSCESADETTQVY
jgi:hypothetical protein